jgi:hypothetical protein
VSIRGRITLHLHDVALNWDTFNHSGNEWYRQLIEKNRSSNDDKKPVTAEAIVQAVHQRVPHGRFLKLSLASNHWTIVPTEEAIDKTLNALHEPSLHQQVPSIRCNKRKLDFKWRIDNNSQSLEEIRLIPARLSLLNEVAVVDVDEEQQIEQDGDQLFGENNTSSSSSSKSNINDDDDDDDDDDTDNNVMGANEVVAVAPPLPILELPPVETVVDVDDEQQIEHKDDLLLRKNKTSSNNDEDGDGSDNSVGSDNRYRTEEGDRNGNDNDDDDDGDEDCGCWRDLGDEYYDIDDDDCLHF